MNNKCYLFRGQIDLLLTSINKKEINKMKWSNTHWYPTSWYAAKCRCFPRHNFTKLQNQENDDIESAPKTMAERAKCCLGACCCFFCRLPVSSMVIRTLASISIVVLIAAIHPDYVPCKVVDLVYLPAYTPSGRPVYGLRATLQELVYNTTMGTNIVTVPRKDADLMAAIEMWHTNSTHTCAYNKLTGVLCVGKYAMANEAVAWTLFCILMSTIAVIYMIVADIIYRRLWRSNQGVLNKEINPNNRRNSDYNIQMFELNSDPDDMVQIVCQHCNERIDFADTNRKLVSCKWGCKQVYHKDCVDKGVDNDITRPLKCKCGRGPMIDYVARDDDTISL